MVIREPLTRSPSSCERSRRVAQLAMPMTEGRKQIVVARRAQGMSRTRPGAHTNLEALARCDPPLKASARVRSSHCFVSATYTMPTGGRTMVCVAIVS